MTVSLFITATIGFIAGALSAFCLICVRVGMRYLEEQARMEAQKKTAWGTDTSELSYKLSDVRTSS